MASKPTAQFGAEVTQLSAPQGAGATPLEGVKEPATQIDLSPVANLFEGVGRFVKGLAEDDAEKAKTKALSDFATKHAALNQSFEQHGNPIRYRAERSKLIDTTLSGNPALTEDISKMLNVYNKGMAGAAEDEEKAERDRRNGLLKDATNQGILPPGSSQEVQESVITAMQEGTRLKNKQSEYRENLKWAQTQDEYTRTAMERQVKEDARKTVVTYAAKHAASFNEVMYDLVKRVSSNKLAPEDAMRMGSEVYQKIQMELSAASSIDPSLAAPFKTIFDNVWEAAKPGFSQGADLKALQTQFEKMKVGTQITIANSDPDMLTLSTLSQMFGNQPQLYSSIHGSVGKFLIANGLKENGRSSPAIDSAASTPIVGNPSMEKDAYGALKRSFEAYKNVEGKSQAVARKEVYGQMNGVISQYVDAYQLNKLTPESRKNMSDFLLDKNTAQFLKENPLPLPLARGLSSAVDDYFKQYKRTVVDALGEVLPGIRTAPKDTTKRATLPDGTVVSQPSMSGLGGFRDQPRSADVDPLDAINITWENGGIKFTPTQIPVDRAEQNRLITKLNQLSVSLTNGVKIGAHVEGSDNYEAFFEKNKHRMFEGKFEAPAQTSQKPAQAPKAPANVKRNAAEERMAQEAVIESSGPDANTPLRIREDIRSIRNEMRKHKPGSEAYNDLAEELDKLLGD